MLLLSALSGIIGFTTLFVTITFCISGIFFFFASRKTDIRLLSIMGVFLFFAGLAYLGICVDFLTILVTGHNTTNLILTYLIWPIVPIAYTLGFYIIFEVLVPKKKLYLISIMILLSLIFELSIFLFPYGNVKFVEPPISGDDLIDDSLIFGSPAGLIGTLFTLIGLSSSIGLIIKGFNTSGVVNKKYYYLALAYFIINLSALLDSLGIREIVSFVRIGSLSSVWFFYLGFRKEPEKRVKKEKKSELKVEESLFRLTKRPDQITEEEVTYYREQKICLVCKTTVGGFNNYIYTNCDALYCENCARALTDLENACWACNEPIEKNKPSKPFELRKKSDETKKSGKK